MFSLGEAKEKGAALSGHLATALPPPPGLRECLSSSHAFPGEYATAADNSPTRETTGQVSLSSSHSSSKDIRFWERQNQSQHRETTELTSTLLREDPKKVMCSL